MKIIFLLALVLFAVAGKAQDSAKQNSSHDTSSIIKVGSIDTALTKVEIESEYPGGQQAWLRYLMKTVHYPEDAVRKRIEGKVVVQFIIDPLGNISNVQAISGPDTGGLREEAERVIKRSGKWIPAIQNGKKVKSYKKQPISFRLG